MRLVLASASPRRKELLGQITQFETVPSRFEEKGNGAAPALVLRFARGKAQEVASRYRDCAVLGADTAVALNGKIFGKPKNEEDARAMLSALSGKTHAVYTGVCLIVGDKLREEVVETKVTFRPLSSEKIALYVKEKKPLDKAGAYGIQDGELVASYEGSYTNVVGLPMECVTRLLKEEGLL